MSPEEELRARPSFEQASREYLAMLDEMRQALSTIVPTLEWKTPGATQDKATAGCHKPFGDVKGSTTGYYDTGGGRGGVPDEYWPQALQTVTEIAKRHGFTEVITVVDKPGHHVVDLYDNREATLQFLTEVNTIIGINGACFLKEEARTSPPSGS